MSTPLAPRDLDTLTPLEVYHIRAVEFFRTTRQGTWNRSEVVKRLGKIWTDLQEELQDRHDAKEDSLGNPA